MIVYNQCPTRILGLRVLGVGFRMFGLKGLGFWSGWELPQTSVLGRTPHHLAGSGGGRQGQT